MKEIYINFGQIKETVKLRHVGPQGKLIKMKTLRDNLKKMNETEELKPCAWLIRHDGEQSERTPVMWIKSPNETNEKRNETKISKPAHTR